MTPGDYIMINRNLFTDSKPSKLERLADLALAVTIGLALCALLLHSCGALFA